MFPSAITDHAARIAALEARCHLLTQALAAVLQQQPNRYRTEIIVTAQREQEAKVAAEREREARERAESAA